ncbi:glycosyltransferase [Paenibacillus macerans]|uniref:glycosyltransferase n=1 Tax=Paenibacillus macerans TaxID=44252 RepID=UPI003D317A6C
MVGVYFKSRRIAYYISDYGYGHATRSIAIIRELVTKTWVSEVIVCTSFSMQLMMQSLAKESDQKLQFRTVKNDIGYVLRKGSVEVDIEGLNLEYDRFVDSFPEALREEQRFLQEKKVDLVISDIPPIPLLAARSLGIPTIGISNFTWYTAYQGLISESKLRILAECYQAIDYFAALAGANEPLWSTYSGRYDFFCRRSDELEVQRLRSRINPDGDKRIVYFGMGMKMDLAALSSLKLWGNENCAFIVSSNIQVTRPHVYQIPNPYTETQNMIAASDIVISKAGWGIISEAMVSDKPMVLLDRRQLNEDHQTLAFLEKQDRCMILPWEDICNLSLDDDVLHHLSFQIGKDSRPNKEDAIHRLVDTIENFNPWRKGGAVI